MNFTSLQYFLVTSQEMNITRAANRLFISQQALSEHIRKLEKELGVTLFDRTHGLTLTYAGRELQDYASKIIFLEKKMKQTALDISNNTRGEIRIGMSHTCSRAILPHILPEYTATHPLVNVILTESNTTDLETGLERGDLDLIIGYAPFGLEDVETVDLAEERFFLTVPKDMMNASFGACYSAIKSECKRSLDISLFKHMPFIMLQQGNRTRTLVDQYLKMEGVTPNIILETDNIETAFALSERGMGLTVYPGIFYWCLHFDGKGSSSPLELFTVNESIGSSRLQIGWMSGRYRTRAAKDFVALCENVLGRLIETYSVLEP